MSSARAAAPCLAALVAAWLGTSPAVALADEAPLWLRAAALATASHPSHVPGAWLLREQRVAVAHDGRLRITERGVLRVLTREGRGFAMGRCFYDQQAGRVSEARGWIVRPSGRVEKLEREHVLDLSAANGVYDEVRTRVIAAGEDAEPGSTFAYEWTVEMRSVFTQTDWSFQDRLPVSVSRFALAVPPGWNAQASVFNHPPIAPETVDGASVWELRELPFVEDEPSRPPESQLVPRLAVSWFPPAGASTALGVFTSWSDVAAWLATLSDPASAPDPTIEARARALADSTTGEWGRLRAIAQTVQAVNYVSIQTGLHRGGGYRPHDAREVLAKSYGDCKDKASLMRAMLAAIGTQAWLVTLYLGDRDYVRDSWATPQQFNHCIVAIRVSPGIDAPATFEHPRLGRLLAFDPTDPYTPLGEIPDTEQGSLALIVDPAEAALTRLPVSESERNVLVRGATVTIAADGAIRAQLSERSVGIAAADERRLFATHDTARYRAIVERWIARTAPAARVTKLETFERAEGRFELEVEFDAPRYAQSIQNRLLAFKPAVVARRERLALVDSARTLPLVLPAEAYRETLRIALPEGYAIDELPKPVRIETDFGAYEANCEPEPGGLRFRRSYRTRRVVLPAARYDEVRAFYRDLRAAEQATVVLERR